MRADVHVSDDPVRMIADRFVELVRDAQTFSVALSGGGTPRPLYRLLATELAERIPWERIRLFQVDERTVPPTHPDSNWRMIQEELVARVPEVNAFPIDATRPSGAQDYEVELRRSVPKSVSDVPVLDLVILGIGPDGHTASLFPETEALGCHDRLVVLNDVPQLDTQRITMTYPLLEAAARRWFLVRGADKAEAFARVRRGELPAGRLTDGEWFVDPAVVGRAGGSG